MLKDANLKSLASICFQPQHQNGNKKQNVLQSLDARVVAYSTIQNSLI